MNAISNAYAYADTPVHTQWGFSPAFLLFGRTLMDAHTWLSGLNQAPNVGYVHEQRLFTERTPPKTQFIRIHMSIPSSALFGISNSRSNFPQSIKLMQSHQK